MWKEAFRGRVTVSNIIAALVILWVGVQCGPQAPPTTVVREIVPEALADSLEALRMEREGLLARIRGVEERLPETIYVTDTLVTAPDTVFRFLTVDSRGLLSYSRLTRTDSLYSPALVSRVRVVDCDSGYQVDERGVTCDKARLGHLWLAADINIGYSSLGLLWRHTYRSNFEVYAGYSKDGPILRLSGMYPIW